MSRKDKPKIKRLTPETLIALAAERLRADVIPALSGSSREAATMIAQALDVARREITTTDEAPQWALLDSVYDEGEGTIQQLAADIRSGKVNDKTNPDLAAKLRGALIAELKVRNPRFLRERGLKI